MLKKEFPTTEQWLNLLKKEKNLTSDYQLAKYLGLTHQAISYLMSGKSVMSDTTALKVADALGYSHLLLILSVSRERLKSQKFDDELEKLPTEFFKASCYILLGFCLSALYFSPSFYTVV